MAALKIHHTATVEESWDGPGSKARLKNDGTASYYRKAFAWVDPEKDPETKAAYKFIHHEVDGAGKVGAANVKACQTGIGVLNGGRGGTTIPSEDREGVHRHLGAHLKDADLDVPELKKKEKKEEPVRHQTFPFEIKEVSEDGTFEGWLSVYDVVDLGFDVVEKGAFTKTLEENGGTVPMLWYHQQTQPVGLMDVEDRDRGLWVKGTFVLEAQSARDAYAYVKAGVVRGLSIGYKAIKREFKDGIRHLKEVKLYEGSLCLFPEAPLAVIEHVKSKKYETLDSVLDWMRVYAEQDELIRGLGWVLQDILYDPELDDESMIDASDATILRFHEKYLELLPKILALRTKAEKLDLRAGYEVTDRARLAIKGAISDLSALIGEGAADTPKEAVSTAGEAAGDTSEGAVDTQETEKQRKLEKLRALSAKL